MYRTYVALYSCLKVHYFRFGTNYTCVGFILMFYSFALCLLLALTFTFVLLTCVRSTYVAQDHVARTHVFHTSSPTSMIKIQVENFSVVMTIIWVYTHHCEQFVEIIE